MKFYGTFGPACCSQTLLQQMIIEGMTGIRMNLSHGNLMDHKEWIEALRSAQKTVGRKIEFLIDLRGPELRIGKMKNVLELQAGDKLLLQTDEEYAACTGEKNRKMSALPDRAGSFGEEAAVPIPAALFVALKAGQCIAANDGAVRLEVLNRGEHIVKDSSEDKVFEKEIYGKGVHCIVLRGGTLDSGKSIGIEGEELLLPILAPEDIQNLEVAREMGVTAVMQPFVGTAEDVFFLREELKAMGLSDLKIFAKIENHRGLRHLEEIIKASDHIVIARGDLGSNIGLENVPATQDLIAAKCGKEGKPFMVVTQLLHSMINQSSPTRAEVCDIYHAVQQGAASLMLTGETAIGRYPLEAMRWLRKVAETTMKMPETEKK